MSHLTPLPTSSPSKPREGLLFLDDLYHTDYLKAGEETEGCRALMNATDEPLQVRVYVQDFHFNLKEEAIFIAPGSLKRSNAAWVEVKYPLFEIPPYTISPFKYVVRVPNDPSLQGSYWSVLMLESAEKISPVYSPDGTRITLSKRYAYQIVTQVGKGVRNLRVMDRRIECINDQKQFVCEIENNGNLSMRLKPSIELFNEAQENLGSFSGEQRIFHPGCSSKFTVDVSSVKRGSYRARLLLQDEGVSVFSTEYSIDIPDALFGKNLE